MSIRQRNAHFKDWAAVCKALNISYSTDEAANEAAARTALESSDNQFYYYVCYIKSANTIYTHGEFYDCSYGKDEEGIAAALSSLATEKIGADSLKTINNNSLVGSGNINISDIYISSVTLDEVKNWSNAGGYFPDHNIGDAINTGKTIVFPYASGISCGVVYNITNNVMYIKDPYGPNIKFQFSWESAGEYPIRGLTVSTFTPSFEEISKISTKQDKLVNQTNIKSINGISLLGRGDITITGADKYEYLDYVIPEGDQYCGDDDYWVPSVKLENLIGVEDTNGNVVAGVYGGRTSDFNDIGASDDTHGTLAFFAGTSDINDVANAPTKIYQDGTLETSKLSATGGNVGVFNIDENQYLRASNDTSETEISHLGIGMVSRNSSGSTEKQVLISGTGGTASTTISNSRSTSSGQNIGLSVQASGSTSSSWNNSIGNNLAIYVSSGDITHDGGAFRGFRPKVRVITSSATLTNYDNIICTNNLNGVITLTLPSNPVDSQMYVIRRLQSDKQENSDVKIYGNGAKIITQHLSNAVSTTDIIPYNNAMVLHYVGVISGIKYWIANYMTY
jgi:hypothetical protein